MATDTGTWTRRMRGGMRVKERRERGGKRWDVWDGEEGKQLKRIGVKWIEG